MTYDEAVDFLENPIYNITRPGLKAIRELLEILGNPEKGQKYIHVAGTNGKGSVSAMFESVLRHAGYKTGLYTSPFITRFTERIRIGEEEISKKDLARLTEVVKSAVDSMVEKGHVAPTIFEMVTAVAFLYFKEKKCDIIILEVGMGGRLDATNVISESELSVITKIGMDHMEFLGDTIEQIAGEKAGIIKTGGTVITSEQVPRVIEVLRNKAKEKGAMLKEVSRASIISQSSALDGQSITISENLYEETDNKDRKKSYEDFLKEKISRTYHISLLGRYQIGNALTVLVGLRSLQAHGWQIPQDAICEGLESASWPGRLEILHKSPLVIVDGAHNPDGTKALAESLKDILEVEAVGKEVAWEKKRVWKNNENIEKSSLKSFHIGKLHSHATENTPEKGKGIVFIMGVMADKDRDSMLEPILPLASRFLTVTPENKRALPAEKLAEELREKGVEAKPYLSIKAAISDAIKKYSDQIICIFGSLYYVGEARLACLNYNDFTE